MAPILLSPPLFYCGSGIVASRYRPMDMPSQSVFKRCGWWVFATLWFLFWHLAHTYQVWQDPLMRVPGPIGDNTVMLWNLGWVGYALNHGHPGFWFPTAYYPEGFLFLYGTHTWLDGFLGWLFSPLLPRGIEGTFLWANLTMAFATVASGLAVIAGLRAWGVRSWPVLVMAASGVVFSWFRMFALQGHYHFYGTQWMLFMLAILSSARARMAETGKFSTRLTCIAGAMLGITFLNDQTMAVFGGILGGIILLAAAFRQPPTYRSTFIAGSFARFYGVAGILASIHLIPILVAIRDRSFTYRVSLDTPRLVDATSLFLPPEIHPAGPMLQPLRETNGLSWAEGTYLGIIPILLLALVTVSGLRYLFAKPGQRPHENRFSFYTALTAWFFLVLALGDSLMIGREIYGAAPGRLLKAIPVVNNIRLPQRWVWPAHLCIALGGASEMFRLLSRIRIPALRWAPLALALISPLEGMRNPPAAPADYRNDAFLNPPGLIESVQSRYKSGGVLLMPPELAYAHANVFQLQWGYDIPVTVAYTARMPFNIQDLPWKGNQWTPEAGEWLRNKKVQMLVFSFHDGEVTEYQPWINQAKLAVPGLIVLNRFGKPI